jgi:hypothetical protein
MRAVKRAPRMTENKQSNELSVLSSQLTNPDEIVLLNRLTIKALPHNLPPCYNIVPPIRRM